MAALYRMAACLLIRSRKSQQPVLVMIATLGDMGSAGIGDQRAGLRATARTRPPKAYAGNGDLAADDVSPNPYGALSSGRARKEVRREPKSLVTTWHRILNGFGPATTPTRWIVALRREQINVGARRLVPLNVELHLEKRCRSPQPRRRPTTWTLWRRKGRQLSRRWSSSRNWPCPPPPYGDRKQGDGAEYGKGNEQFVGYQCAGIDCVRAGALLTSRYPRQAGFVFCVLRPNDAG
jgi:hypothetical protein